MEAAATSTDTLEDEDVGLRLVKSVVNLICVCHGDRIMYINPAGARLLGAATTVELIGRPLPEFIDPDYAELMEAGLDTFAEEQGGVPLKMIPVAGEPRDVKLFVTRLKVADQPVFMIEALDITEFIRAAEATKLREQRLKGILDTVAEGIVAINEQGQILAFNPAAERLFGYKAREAINQNVSMLMPEPHRSRHDGYIATYLKTREAKVIGQTVEMEGLRKNGSTFPMEITVSELREGRSRAFIGAMRDITKRKEFEAQIKRLAHHDPLTGLPNRNLYNDRLANCLGRSYRNQLSFALMFVDLDKFKPINDTHGHDAGDFVLKSVSDRLRIHLRATDTIARLGGDEFVVILESVRDRADVARIADKLIASLVEPMDFNGIPLKVGASIGISVYPDDGFDAETLTKCADEAMYKVKEAGRNHYRFYGD
jgi:diguanylate cyclase (GGDEF)-like protein/PAS domain S-box-containing protein